ncbi:MAG: acetyl-CoA hydrolase/transferase C-terminal domain-containing protein, partial [Bacteroidales bacterium]
MALKFITAEEAASYINHNDNVGFSGFTAAGCPKAVPAALAKRAIEEHEKGNPFQIGMFTGASTGDAIDGNLARANAIKFRTPYQSNGDLRKSLNAHDAAYFDMHLSQLAQELRYGFYGKVNVAIVEAADVTEDGEIVPTCGVGIIPTVCKLADKIIVELNSCHPKAIRGMHDIYEPLDPPLRREIPIYKTSDRIGSACVKVDPSKIIGVVETSLPNEGGSFAPLDDVTLGIGNNVANFLASEMKAGRIPAGFLPLQSGVGNVANAVLAALGNNKDIPAFEVYTEVIQDAVITLMKEGRVKFASGCSLTVSNPVIEEIYANLDFFKDKVLLRPQEISNNPEIVRRLGLITINTALEADIFGNINSTHVLGTKMMNGIGGSGDFTRNAYLSMYTTPSIAKDGKISSFVP